ERAQVSMARVFESETVERVSRRADRGKRVEHADGARMFLEQWPEIRLAQPAVDARADLDADDPGNGSRFPEPPREIDLSKPTLPEQTIDAVLEPTLGAEEEVAGCDEGHTTPEPRKIGRAS